MRSRATLALVAIAAALTLGGCPPIKSCRPGTLFLTVRLDATSAAADQLQVLVQLGEVTRTGAPFAHRAGAASGTVEVDFGGGYPANQSATVTVNALSAGSLVGNGARSLSLGGACQAASIDVAAVGVVGDGPDLAGGDDGGTTDLAVGNCSPASCASGICADGVCCDKACQGQCEACDVAGSVGTCTPVSGKPHGHRVACDGAGTVCAGKCDGTNRTGCGYPGPSTSCGQQSCTSGVKTLAVSCDGAGNCPASQTVQCTPAMCNSAGSDCASLCVSDTDCNSVAGKPYCDHGACTAHKPNGRPCSAVTDCNSGNCADGYCCDQACGGQCQACDVAGALGTCTPVTSGAPHGVSGGTRQPCAGTGVCQGSCAAGQTASCTLPTSQCAGGTCSNGTDSPAVFCNNGSCPSVSTMTCPNGLECNAAGTGCRPGPCASDADCQSGFYCAAGGACTPQKSNGQTCNLTTGCNGMSNCRQCTSGNCVDGYCCDSACGGKCEACDNSGAQGSCKPVSGAPHGGRGGCGGSGVCAGSCDGANVSACSFPTVQCTSQTCSGGVVTFASSCSNGACVAPSPPTQTCGAGQVCMGNNCGGCSSDAQCGSGKYCGSTGSCQVQKGNGLTCGLKGTSNSDCYNNGNCGECASGFCVDGYCCGTACGGQCQNCNANPGSCQLTGSAASPAQPVSNAGTTRAACAGSGSCQQACNGSSATACADPSPEPVCVAASCVGGVATAQVACSLGSCPTATRTNCAPYTCNPGGTACLTSCTKDSDCVAGSFCAAGGVCQAQKAQGATCGLSGTSNPDCYLSGNCAECSTGFCTDGYCCNSACNGGCDRCDGKNGQPAGTCAPAPAGFPTAPHSCGGTGVCAGSCNGTTNACQFGTGACTGANRCAGMCSGGVCDAPGTTCGTHTCCQCGCTGGSPNTCALCM